VFREAAESIGTGLLSEIEWLGVTANGGVTPWVTLTLVDTSIADVPDSVLTADQGGTFRIVGKRAGKTKLIGSSLYMIPDTMTVFVSTSHLHFGDWDFPERPRLVPLGSEARASVVAQDSLGRAADPAGQVAVSIASRDTNIVKLPQNQDPYILRPIGQGIPLFPVIPVDTGRAWVVATATGWRADSVLYVVTALPKVVFTKGPVHMLGAGQRNIDGAAFGTTKGWDHGGDVLVTFTRRHPEVAAFPDTLTLPANALYWPLAYIGRTPGVDTIIASASGYEPDTTVLYVTTPHFLPTEDTVRGTTVGAYAAFEVGDSTGTRHSTDSALLVLATPADTSIARAASGRVPAQWSPGWTIGITTVDTGTTTVTLTDSAGRYAPASYTLRVLLDTSFHLEVYDSYEVGAPAPRQRFENTRFVLYIPPSPAPGRVVHLTPTTPRVLRVPDSIVVQGTGFNYVSIAAGDTVGTSRIIVSAPGFRTDTSPTVQVKPGQLHLIAPDSVYVGYGGYGVRVAAWTGGCSSFLPMDTAATFTLIPLDAGIVVDSNATVAAGQICSPLAPVTFTSPGHLRLAVQDHRAVPVRYAADTVSIVVRRPRLIFQYPYPPNVGVGQRLFTPIRRDGNAQDNVTVTLTHSSSHAGTTGPLQMNPGVYLAAEWVDGVSIGRDTLIISAPGYDGDTLPVVVTEGKVTLENWHTQIKRGDSVAIFLYVGDSTGLQHPVTAATSFAIETTGGIVITNGSQTVGTITVPAGQDGTSIPYYVKAVGPAGSASVRFVNLYYMDQTFSLTVTP
jgi:hypothetical protein